MECLRRVDPVIYIRSSKDFKMTETKNTWKEINSVLGVDIAQPYLLSIHNHIYQYTQGNIKLAL